jgi:hypothetical protein
MRKAATPSAGFGALWPKLAAKALKCHVCPMCEAGAAQMAGCWLGRNNGIRNKGDLTVNAQHCTSVVRLPELFLHYFKQETNNE